MIRRWRRAARGRLPCARAASSSRRRSPPQAPEGARMTETMSPGHALRLAFRFSAREMRGGLSGFLIFIACIALGVAAIGGVNSLARSIATGIESQGRDLLGGDMRFQLVHR